jgi:hypothetical protein
LPLQKLTAVSTILKCLAHILWLNSIEIVVGHVLDVRVTVTDGGMQVIYYNYEHIITQQYESANKLVQLRGLTT